ncbi:TIGR00730 family Rossman fold protein [Methylobacterium radiodurans]|uniref:Cytokinin riboside 5'-monophosphate phosphoribohydrolase n=1 Tax=Methylobacterium radiodurans TaxID=2202828 RepID=A0A2U8VNW3_9HYPH|nr:TIGR00730 family Rossman fold protein [Methylobacterium radiodurans]AWN35082.1 TIGR00730 family Rossman fold protein [Methylobacterium radiodurans]
MRLCVFCGSNDGFEPIYREAASRLGRTLALEGIGLVYGGGRSGLMGTVADAALAHGGEVTGVMPAALVEKEVAHRGLTDLRVVGSMHERKALMSDLADGGYVGLPGGLGTFEELFEVWTWGQLGYHRKPVSILNVAGFYDDMLRFLDGVAAGGFLRQPHRDMLIVAREPEELLRALRAYDPPNLTKWLGRGET